MAAHKPWPFFMILFAFVALVVTTVFHYAGSAYGRKVLKIPDGWFLNDATSMNSKYILKISPSEWIDQFWAFVYFFQLLWIGYSLSLIFRTTSDRSSYLYAQGFMPSWLFFVFVLNLTANLGFIFSYDRDQQVAATVMRFMMIITLIICMVLTYRYLHVYGGQLLLLEQNIEVYLARALVQNGLALYLGWVSFLSAMSMGSNMAHTAGLSMKDSCTVGVCIVGIQVLIYVPLDLLTLDRYMRYTFTTYLPLMVGLSGVIIQSYSQWERNTVITCVILSVVIVGFGFKVGLALIRHRRWPEPLLYPKNAKKSTMSPVDQMVPLQYMTGAPQQPQQVYPYFQPQPVATGQQLALTYVPSTKPVQQSVYQAIPASFM